MDVLKQSLIPLLAALALAGCEANGGFPGAGGGGGGGGGGEPLEPGDDISGLTCVGYASGAVTSFASGGGCELSPLTGEVCSVTEPDNAGDGDATSFATVAVNATGLDVLTDLGDSATEVGLEVALGGTVSPGPNTVAAFDIEVPTGGMDISVLQRIVVSTFLGGEATGESINVGAMGDIGGFASGGRQLAGFVPEMDFDAIRIEFGADGLTLDADDTAFVFDVCTRAEAPAEEDA